MLEHCTLPTSPTKLSSATVQRLATAILWLMALMVGHWYHDAPSEVRHFIESPLFNLTYSPLFSIIVGSVGLTGLVVLQERASELFAARRWWSSIALASLITLTSPFQLSTGLLFTTLLLAGSALLSLLGREKPASFLATPAGVRGIFFISGMAALIYQVTWQKKLFSLLGADGQSVTVIVAVFLGGLGVGALLGDKLAPRLTPRQGILAFCLIELAAGLFGAVSIPWLDWIGLSGAALLGDPFSPSVMIIAATLAVGLPTLLMGMTLPLLVEVLQSNSTSMHHNVGTLYAINALGSAVASFLAGTLLFTLTGLLGATWLAAALNGLTALLVLLASRRWSSEAAPPQAVISDSGHLSWPIAALLATATGFISIGLEILLLRMMNWATAGSPWTFGIGIAAFLLGLCMGSLKQAHLPAAQLARHGRQLWLLTALVIWLLPALAALLGGLTAPTVGAFALAATLGLSGWLGGCSLPLIAGQIRANQDGKRHFGAVYAANIAGSVSGAIITGYVLFEHFPAVTNLALFAVLSLLVATAFAAITAPPVWHLVWPLQRQTGLAIVLLSTLFPLAAWTYPQWREFLYQGTVSPEPFIYAKESRGGIIAVQPDRDGNVVVGGGAYDGRLNVDPLRNSNLISRTYIAMAMHPAPRQVLQIGLASGSWAKAMLSFPTLEKLVSIEINAGYLDLIANAPLVADILNDPRSHFVIADGRKWLHAHPEQWDLIVINNTFHWREGATLLHSREFMTLARSRLRPNGQLFLNTTGAGAISATALRMFPEVYQVSNGIVAVNGHLPLPDDELLGQRLAQSSVFSAKGLDATQAGQWLAPHRPVRLTASDFSSCLTLTDDSMAAEWGKAACQPEIH